jgi:hypothetical protein
MMWTIALALLIPVLLHVSGFWDWLDKV